MVMKQVGVKLPQKFLVMWRFRHCDLTKTQLLLDKELVEDPECIGYLGNLRISEVFFRLENYLVELVHTLRGNHEFYLWLGILAYLDFDKVLLVKKSCVLRQFISLLPLIVSLCT